MTWISAVERILKKDRSLLVGMIGLLFVLAGLYTVLGVGMETSSLEMTAMRGRGMHEMPGTRLAGDWSPSFALLVFLMWWVMMIAMMLPSVAPTVLLHSALLRQTGWRGDLPAASGAFLIGYLAAWAGFSFVAAAVQWGAESAGLVSPTTMTLTGTLPGGILLIAAGVFQFASLKAACLDHCRSPFRFLTERGRPGIWGAFMMGLEHGTYCLGCCWLLMALLFVGGIMNLYWIVGLAAFVALEKLTAFGPTLSRIAGVALVARGAWAISISL
ncbi:DUF2182 domain-containing protein [Salipiger sp. PrR002]|uniref:DUF2182 domain-containing protein n=1 Tax=Salipiger sp. PrR002 TaxID=2706489 RepID=UPI0013BC2C79|nr:DUF2182 domain-containing protein [Salipiger sp. PrR002]NDW02716.1 DUF2182 domain-containing protein [Salipiger sp. PrR002]NDW60010.1 DUF2182 domain-containing protein [Salipiger sp. PrR004]